ncbi:MAG: Trp biosynthesis-associated membrane protein [Pseudolysinimonas sp.]
MTPSRLRLLSVAAIVLTAGGAALSWSQTWYVLSLDDTEHAVGGDVAGGALLPLALASLCVVFALGLAGPVFRTILAVLDALLGVCVIVVTAWSLSDPVRASLPALVEATGFSGTADGFRDQLTGTIVTVWPWLGLVAGVLMTLTGIAIAVTGRGWPASGSRYTRTRAQSATGDPVRDWDALSEGDDPTAGPR